MNKELKVGDLVQLDPALVENRAFANCIMVVTEIRPWGAQGYVQSLGTREEMGGQAYYRAQHKEMKYVGQAHWIVK